MAKNKKGEAQGKQPKGRAAQRGKAQKGSPRSGGWQSTFQFVDDADDNPQRQFRGFSQGNPRNLQQSTPNVKLRHQAISFVSAGSGTPAQAEEERDFVEEAIAVAAEHEETEDESEVEVEDEDEDADEDEDEEIEDNEEEVDDSTILTNIVMDTDTEISEGAMAQMNLQSTAETPSLDTNRTNSMEVKPTSSEALPFFVDTVGDPDVQFPKANGKRPVRRSPSLAPSDSSEEVVVFHGRGRSMPATIDDPVSQPAISQPSQSPHVTDGLLAALEVPSASARPSTSQAKGWAMSVPKYQIEQEQAPQTWQAAPSTPYWKKGKGKQRPDLDPSPAEKLMLEQALPRNNKVMFVEPEQSNAEETIASLQADFKRVLKEKKKAKEGGKLDGNDPPKDKMRRKRGDKNTKNSRQRREAIVEAEEDEQAAYDDYMENMKAQLDGEMDISAFTPINGTARVEAGPSLVVDGKEIADTELLKEEWEDETSSESEGPIGQDLSELSDDDDRALNYSDLDSSELEDELDYTEREQWEDEEDLRQRRITAMDDEQIARLYAKQIELGIDSDDLVIDDGVQAEGVGDLSDAYAGLNDVTNSAFGRSANKHGMRRTGRGNGGLSFPDASALADTVEQYGNNGFDIMDFERPSLRPRKKGRKGKLPPELEAMSDEELKEEMTKTWENDRSKKRLKKAEREELRMQGLLGATGKKGKADLGQKYVQGMTMQQVHDELRIFLQDDGQNSRPFPPMDKKDRKALHMVADKLNLKSKSVGSGHNRFPILYKTAFTVAYSEAQFDKLIHASTRGFLTNSAHRGKQVGKANKFAAKSRPGRGGGFDKTATSLRNGEVVGAGAAEIGKESFGHKMMEKMGWTKGMALGKEGEGMLVPVQQVMRAGKAGLG